MAALTAPGRRLTSLDKAMDILEWFSAEQRLLGPTEAARVICADKSTASRILARLSERGLLARTEEGRYRLGLRLFELGSLAVAGRRVGELAVPALRELAQRWGRTVQLCVPAEGHAVVVASVEATSVPRLVVPLGARVPLHASAAGKVIAAFRAASLSEMETETAGRLRAYASNTITDPERLAAELAGVRRRGYARARDEFFAGQCSLAAPVFDHQELAAALTLLSAPGSGSLDERRLAPELVREAARLSAALGGGRA